MLLPDRLRGRPRGEEGGRGGGMAPVEVRTEEEGSRSGGIVAAVSVVGS